MSAIGDILTRDQIYIRINNGGYNMPAYAPSLSSQDLELIVDFLESRKKYEGAPLKLQARGESP